MKNKSKIIIIILSSILVCFLAYKFFPKDREVIDKDAPVYKQEDVVAPVKIINKEMVQIRFSWEIDGIKYNDALNIEKSQYEKMTPEQIEKLKKERFENWVKTVNEQSKQ